MCDWPNFGCVQGGAGRFIYWHFPHDEHHDFSSLIVGQVSTKEAWKEERDGSETHPSPIWHAGDKAWYRWSGWWRSGRSALRSLFHGQMRRWCRSFSSSSRQVQSPRSSSGVWAECWTPPAQWDLKSVLDFERRDLSFKQFPSNVTVSMASYHNRRIIWIHSLQNVTTFDV